MIFWHDIEKLQIYKNFSSDIIFSKFYMWRLLCMNKRYNYYTYLLLEIMYFGN